jgi:hypothetical protein
MSAIGTTVARDVGFEALAIFNLAEEEATQCFLLQVALDVPNHDVPLRDEPVKVLPLHSQSEQLLNSVDQNQAVNGLVEPEDHPGHLPPLYNCALLGGLKGLEGKIIDKDPVPLAALLDARGHSDTQLHVEAEEPLLARIRE